MIKKVAAAVGPSHKVDLQGYDLLILVEIYKVRICQEEDNLNEMPNQLYQMLIRSRTLLA